MTDGISLTDFPVWTSDTIRYGDTDRLGHVNNAVFATFLETGRVGILHDPATPLFEPGSAFVIARLLVEFKSEITWPGTVDIGTRVKAVGRSSITLEQALVQNVRCVATAESVIVLMDETTRRSRPLSAAAITSLSSLILGGTGAGRPHGREVPL